MAKKKNEDIVNIMLEKTGDIAIAGLKYTGKHLGLKIIKALKTYFKTLIIETLKVKTVVKYKLSRYMLIACTLISFIILAYLNIKVSWLSIFTYFIIKAFIQAIKDYIQAKRIKKRIKKLNKKYEKVRMIFDNKINIVNINNYKATVFSNEITRKELEAKKERLELFFNRDISFIVRKNGDFKYNDIHFFVETSFKKYYKFQDYFNFINLKSIKNMYLPMLLGIDEKEQLIIEDLAEMKHLFISGQSGGGKSSLINCIIQSLMVLRDNNIYILIDLKGGAELSDYKDFDNIILIHNIEDMHKIIIALEKVMEQRLTLIRNTRRCKDINGYMKQSGEKLNNFVVVIDEIASIRVSGYDFYKSLENSLLQILQKGRVTNICCIGATQKPSGNQFNTDVRAGFLQSISFRVKDRYTQQQTGVLGTERLKTGEYKTTFLQDKIIKGFLIRDTPDLNRKLPECNGVFDDLEHKLINKKFFITIKEKPLKTNKRFLHWLQTKLNKTSQNKLSGLIDYRQLIKDIKPSIMKEIDNIYKLSGIENLTKEIPVNIHADNYNNFLEYIFVNNKDGKLPSTKAIERVINISRDKRLSYLKRAIDDEMLIKKNERVTLINFEHPDWNKFRMKNEDV